MDAHTTTIEFIRTKMEVGHYNTTQDLYAVYNYWCARNKHHLAIDYSTFVTLYEFAKTNEASRYKLTLWDRLKIYLKFPPLDLECESDDITCELRTISITN